MLQKEVAALVAENARIRAAFKLLREAVEEYGEAAPEIKEWDCCVWCFQSTDYGPSMDPARHQEDCEWRVLRETLQKVDRMCVVK